MLLQLLQLLISPWLVLLILHFLATLPMLCPLPFFSPQNLSNGFASSSSLFEICPPPLHVILCNQGPVLPLALFDHTTDLSSGAPLSHPLYFIVSLHCHTAKSYHFCIVVSSHPEWSHAFSQSAASNSLTDQLLFASILPFDLIFFVVPLS